MFFDDDILAIAATSRYYCIALVSGHIHAFSASSNKLLWKTRRHKGGCRGLAYSPDGTQLLSIGADRVIKQCDSETGKATKKWIDAHDDPINAVIWTSDATFATGDDAGQIKCWPGKSFETHEDYISQMIWSGTSIISASGDGTVAIHDKKLVKRSDDQDDDLTCLCTIKSKILVGGSDGVIRIFNVSDIGDCNDRIPAPVKDVGVECLAVDKDVIVGLSNGSVWSLSIFPNKYRRELGRFKRGDPVIALAVCEGRIYAASGREMMIIGKEEEKTSFFNDL